MRFLPSIFQKTTLTVAFSVLLLSLIAGRPADRGDYQHNPPLGEIKGWIVFDSNRSGQFDIYKMRPDGSSVIQLTDTPESETGPDWSPDGTQIVFARKEAGDDNIVSDIYIMDSDGVNERLLIKKGTAPQFSSDGEWIIFERDRVNIMAYHRKTGIQQDLVLSEVIPSFKYHMIKPCLSPDLSTVLFISDKGGKWHSWAMDLEGKISLIGKGCQPTWHPDGRQIFFIFQKSSEETAIWSYRWPDGPASEYLELEGTYRHVYFPSVSDDGRYLLFSACPFNQHDHSSAPYQIFIASLDGGKPIRISFNNYTERWPRLSSTAR